MTSKEALEFIIKTFNELAQKPQDIGLFFNFCEAHEKVKQDLDRLEQLEKIIKFLKPHTHLASGLCEIKLADREVSELHPKYHNGKEVYESNYDEFHKLFSDVLKDK